MNESLPHPTSWQSADRTTTPTPASSGFWRRVVASCIDENIILLLRLLLLTSATPAISEHLSLLAGPFGVVLSIFWLIGALLVSFFVGWVYYAGFESSSYQATPGKLLMQAYVADTSGGRISFLHSIGRNLAKILSTMTLGIGYLMAAFTSRKQALHDLVAGTVVLKRPGASRMRVLIGVFVALLLGILAQQLAARTEEYKKIGETIRQDMLSGSGAESKIADPSHRDAIPNHNSGQERREPHSDSANMPI